MHFIPTSYEPGPQWVDLRLGGLAASAALVLILDVATSRGALTTTIKPDPWPNVAPFGATRTCDVERDSPRRTPSAILNVYDIENDTLSVDSFTQPTHGKAESNGDGTFNYTPTRGFPGADQFSVGVSDGHGGNSITTMKLRVVQPTAGYPATRFGGMFDIPAIDLGPRVAIVPRAIDWDRDGDLDVIFGANGSVHLCLNTGSRSAPVLAPAVTVRAAGTDIAAGNDRVSVAWADFDDDGVPDLVVGNGSNGKITYYRTTTRAGRIELATGITLRNADNSADFVAADFRIDVADWNGDGKPDVITGTSSGNVKIAYNVSTAGTPHVPLLAEPVIALDSTGLAISGSYNGSPRVIDLTRNGKPDMLVAWNWGNIDFRANQGTLAKPLLGDSGHLEVSLADGTAPDLHNLTDGAFVELADFNADGVLDLLFGGHISGKVRLAFGVGANTDLANIESTVAEHPADLGVFLAGNAGAKAQMKQRLGSVYDFVTGMASPSQVDSTIDALERLITSYPQYFKAQVLDVTQQPAIPSMAAMLHLTMLMAKYEDPGNRKRTAVAAGMSGAYRKLCEDIGLLYLENYRNPDGAEAIWQWARFMPRDIYPGTGITQQESLGGTDYLVRGHMKNTFAGSATSGGEFGFAADARAVLGERGSESFLMTVVHHEATHDLDAYVTNHLPPDFRRRWGQLIVRAGGHDAKGVNYLKEDPVSGWFSPELTQAHFKTNGWWNGAGEWSSALKHFYTSGAGRVWKDHGFMRGDITFFLDAPQESLATQGNQYWNSTEGRLEVALERWHQGYDTNITEVLHFMDVQSKGANKLKFWENNDSNEQVIAFARLHRNQQGYISGVDVNDHSYRFTVNSQGVVTEILQPKYQIK